MFWKKWWWVFVVGVIIIAILVVILVVLIGAKLEKERELARFENRGLPIMNIELNGISTEDIYKDGKDVVFENNLVEMIRDGEINYYDGVEIKGRGNTTSVQPKKPYQIKFKTKADLTNNGGAKKWILLANYLDVSQIRDDIALKIAGMLDMEFSYIGDFVELYIDSEYQGTYYLIKKIEINKGSVDLKSPEGVLFELDDLHRFEEICYLSYFSDCLVLKDTTSKDENSIREGTENFLSNYKALEIAVENGNYETIKQLIDVDSFVKYFLVNEFTVNPDAYSSSFYLYKDGLGGKIHAGPVWDFDYALGNRQWVWAISDEFFMPDKTTFRRNEAFGLNGLSEDTSISKLFYYLIDIPDFREEIKKIYREKMQGREAELMAHIQNTIKNINRAVEVDNQKWGIENFKEETIRLIEWVKQRYEYFEQLYGNNVVENRVEFL